MKNFGLTWPDFLECKNFPESNDHGHMCIPKPMTQDQQMSFKNNNYDTINSLQFNDIFMNQVKKTKDKLAEGEVEVSHIFEKVKDICTQFSTLFENKIIWVQINKFFYSEKLLTYKSEILLQLTYH